MAIKRRNLTSSLKIRTDADFNRRLQKAARRYRVPAAQLVREGTLRHIDHLDYSAAKPVA